MRTVIGFVKYTVFINQLTFSVTFSNYCIGWIPSNPEWSRGLLQEKSTVQNVELHLQKLYFIHSR